MRYGFSVYEIAARRCGATPVEAPDADYGTDVDALLALRDRADPRGVPRQSRTTRPAAILPRAELARLHAGAARATCCWCSTRPMPNMSRPSDDDGGLALAARARQRAGHPDLLQDLRPRRRADRLGDRRARADRRAQPASAGRSTSPTAAQAAALAALGDQDFVARSRAHNRAERARFVAAIEALGNHGLRARAERGQFRAGAVRGRADRRGGATTGLAERGYAVRWLPGQGLPHGLRITIGTREQMDEVAAALRDAGGGRAMSFARVAIIGLGLLGGSIGLAVREHLPGVATTGYDSDPAGARRAPPSAGWPTTICDTRRRGGRRRRPGDPVRAGRRDGRGGARDRRRAAADALVSDVGSSKQTVASALAEALPGHASSPRTRSPAPSTAGPTRASPRCSTTAGASSPRPTAPTRPRSRRWSSSGKRSAPWSR